MKRQSVFLFLSLSISLAAISQEPLAAKESSANAKVITKKKVGWTTTPKGCFDPNVGMEKDMHRFPPHMACDSRAPHRIEGINYLVHGGIGWHFSGPKDSRKKKRIYGISIEEDVANGNRVEAELAIPIQLIAEELHEVGMKGRVEWDPRKRLVKIVLGENVFEYQFPEHPPAGGKSAEAKPKPATRTPSKDG